MANKQCWVKNIWLIIWQSPYFHAIATMLFSICSGVFGSGMVNDLNENGKTVWSFDKLRNSNSCLLLGSVFLIYLLYVRFYVKREHDIMAFGSDEYCTNLARYKLAPEMLNNVQNKITNNSYTTQDLQPFLDLLQNTNKARGQHAN